LRTEDELGYLAQSLGNCGGWQDVRIWGWIHGIISMRVRALLITGA
jgi:hypothetical protein